MSKPRTIIAMGTGVRKEATAAGVINPGDLVVINASGAIGNATAGAKASPMFAIENEIFGDAVYNDGVLTSYAIGQRCLTETMSPGQEVYATVAAGAAAIVAGDPLSAAADGTLAKAGSETAAGILARATEALDNSASADKAHVRCTIV